MVMTSVFIGLNIKAVASFVFRARGIVCVELSIVSFFNHRPCLDSY